MEEQNSPIIFCEWLKHRRKTLDMTQDELAKRTGCSIGALRKIESGDRRPSKQLAALLAKALEIPDEDQPTFIRVARGELNFERLPSTSNRRPFASVPTTAPAFTQLPIPSSPLVGRDRELAALERMFNDSQCRLLTLTGLGGIGKTRLALEFASSQRTLFPGGVIYVPLAALDFPDQIIPTIADALRLTLSGPIDPEEQLINYLSSRTKGTMLIVLDNMEHLLAQPAVSDGKFSAVDLVMDVLQRLPNVKILATSRERLNLLGEWMYELHGLPVPPSGYAGSLDDFGACTLFMLSGRKVQADYEEKADEKPALIEVCRLLEGIPLAIELAASWVKMLSCQEIVQEIKTNLDFLMTSMRDIPERHRSIRATFDHSWKLLSDEERCVLRRLSVFHGSFSREAAENIAGASLARLTSLVSKSLVRRIEPGRFDLHEVIRVYALAHLEWDPKEVDIHDLHSVYYLAYVRDRERAMKSASQPETIRELVGQMDNLRAAWIWAVRRNKFTLIGGALRCFGWFCDVAGWLDEGIEQMELVIQSLRGRAFDIENKKILGSAFAQQGMLYFRKGLFDRAQACYEDSLSILRPIGDPALLTDALVFDGIIKHSVGEMGIARSLIEEGLACARAAHDRWFEALALFNMGYLDSLSGSSKKGYEQMLASLDISRTLGDPSALALGLNYICTTAIRLGHLVEARDWLEESLVLCQQVGDRWGMGTAYRNLGLVVIAQGDPHEALSILRKSLEIFGGYTVGWDIAQSLNYMGQAALMMGDLAESREFYRDALHVASEVKAAPIMLDVLVGLGRILLQTGEIERAVEIAALAQGHPASMQDTRDSASRVILEAGSRLDEGAVSLIIDRITPESMEAIAAAF